MKKIILTPNPYRDKNFQTVRSAMKILRESGVEVRLCLPFEIDKSYDLPRDLRFSRLDREIGIEKVAITIIRRVADPGDYHRGLTNALQMETAPTHQAVDLMTIMPHVDATGILVHTPVTHGHIITVLATAKDGKKITKEMALAAFRKHPRIRVVTLAEGFKGNASFFKYARDLGNRRGDMYEVGLWEDSIVESGNDIMYAINIPQESVTIPETMDAVRAATGMQLTREEGTAKTNEYLKIGTYKK